MGGGTVDDEDDEDDGDDGENSSAGWLALEVGGGGTAGSRSGVPGAVIATARAVIATKAAPTIQNRRRRWPLLPDSFTIIPLSGLPAS